MNIFKSAGGLLWNGVKAAGRNFDRNASGPLPELLGADFTPAMRRQARGNAIMALGQHMQGIQPLAQGLQAGQAGMFNAWNTAQQLKREREARAAMAGMAQGLTGGGPSPAQQAGPGAGGPVAPPDPVQSIRTMADRYRVAATKALMAGLKDHSEQLLKVADSLDKRAEHMDVKPVGAPISVRGPEGKPMLLQPMSNGMHVPVTGYEPEADVTMVNAGDKIIPVDKRRPPTLPIFMGMTPGEKETHSQNMFMRPIEQQRADAATTGARASATGANAAAMNATAAGPQRSMSNEGEIRNEYMKYSAPHIVVRDSYQKVLSAAKDPSAAGDIALVYATMKAFDPGSTVREGEFATAQNAGSAPDKVRALYNKIVSGERLSPNVRADFVNQVAKIYQGSEASHKKVKDYYTAVAGRYNLNPANIIQDLSLPPQPGAPAAPGLDLRPK